MATFPLSAKAVFDEAVEIVSPDARRDYLERACADAPVLRQEVEALLAAYADAGSFLESPPAPPGESMDPRPAAERPGAMIGRYKLLRQIGEGGMGVVWMAEQTQPVQREVALKVIKPGMDSKQVVVRFEAERQALAVMDHVNIAHVYDGGATEGGLPYFVMELVHGVPITKYCDDNHLTPRERLELFVPVCQAIQHAHQKGIIHRDIKPSNVMVTLQDGKPVPKVIDFGVAKATEQKLSDRTRFTHCGTLVGTLEYMSPEQAEMSALGVDTRSDIFSLGVLLYELLTGSTPLTHERIKEAAHAELLRLIKEEEPPKPSTRLSHSGAGLASISANRHTEPARLTQLMRGDLDWILLKCLEKDRTRRYETANGLAVDILRHLHDEPVTAGAPGAGYKLRKFVRRNRAQVLAAGIVAGALVLGVVGTTTGMVWALDEKDRANAERTKAILAAESAGRSAKQARQSEEEARFSLADSHLAQAREMRLRREIGFREAGLKLLERAAAVRGSTLELRNEALANLAQSDLVVESRFASTLDAQFGRGAAMEAGCLVCATRTGEFLVRPQIDTEQGEYRIFPPEKGDETVSAGLSPDGRYLIAAFQKRFSHDVRLFVWDVTGRRRLWTQALPGQVPTLRWGFHPESPTVAIAYPDRTVRVHDLADGSVVRVIPVGRPVCDLLFLRIGTGVPALLMADSQE